MDAIDHPSHYNVGSIEVIDAIESWSLDFHLGNVVKYIARAPHKGKFREDLEKAAWYLERYLTVGGTQRDDGRDVDFRVDPRAAATDWKLPTVLKSIVLACARKRDLDLALENLIDFIPRASMS